MVISRDILTVLTKKGRHIVTKPSLPTLTSNRFCRMTLYEIMHLKDVYQIPIG